MAIILFGFKGSGKTYFGSRLSEELALPFIDTDQLIESRYQMSCRELASARGEAYFRKVEKEIILSLDPADSFVIALGGGAVVDPENVAHLQKGGKLIWLQADKETLKERFFQGTWLPHSFEEIYAARMALYQTIGAPFVASSGRSESEILHNLKAVSHGMQ